MLIFLLQIDEDQEWDGKHHLEEDGRTMSTMMFDPSVENKHIDVTRIDFKFEEATSCERGIFFKHVEIEFELLK